MLPNLQHGEGDAVTIAVAVTGFPNVTYSATGLPPGITISTGLDINGRVTGILSGTLTRGVGGTDPMTNAGTYTGSEGVHAVVISASDGSTSNTFTWDVGRWGVGDVFVGAGQWVYQAYAPTGEFKYDVTMPDNPADTWGGTTGCAANWRTGEVWTTNFDNLFPAVNVIQRHAQSAGLPYTDLSRRLGTERYFAGQDYLVDTEPESIAFDNDQNMYVGHSFGFYNNAGDPADANGTAVILLDPPGASGYVFVDATGTPILTSTGNSINYDQWISPTGHFESWLGGVASFLLNGTGQRILAPEQAGMDVHKYALTPSGYTTASRQFFNVRIGQTGADTLDLMSDQRTAIYSSESQYVYRYDLQTGTQLPVVGSDDLAAPTSISPRPIYGVRILAPGDGTGGYLTVTEQHINRVDQNGRIVQQYDVLNDADYPDGNVDGWFAIAIAPSARTFWAANRSDVFHFDIASGEVIGNKIHATEGTLHTNAELAGLCVVNEYRAAQEVCGVTGLGNGLDDDFDGVIDEGCFRIETCGIASPGDDDGDGLVDYNDPDCGATEERVCAAAGPTDSSVAGFCERANAEGELVVVPGIPRPCTDGCADWTFSYVATGLPNGLTMDPETGEVTGTPVYSIVNPNSALSPPEVHTVTVTGAWTQTGRPASTFTQTFDWTIYNTNRNPTAVNDSAQTTAGTPVAIDVRVNDSDVDGDPFTVLSFTQPTVGTVAQVGQNLVYTPPPTFGGVVTFTYRLQDNYAPVGVSNDAVVTVVVNGPPVARDDFYEMGGGTTLTIGRPNGIINNAAGSDSDPEGESISVVGTSVSSPAHGSVSVNPDGSFSYTPTPGFSGTDTFTYVVTDGLLSSNTATVTILVHAPPVAVNDSYTTNVNTTLNVGVQGGLLTNDSNPDGGNFWVVPGGWTAPSHGTVGPSSNGDGGFTYIPALNYVGTDSFTYKVTNGRYESNWATVTITILEPNRPPVAVNDEFWVSQGALLTVVAGTILGNDSDPDRDAITAELVSNPVPAGGTFAFAPGTGAFTYTSTPTFYGDVTFTYLVRDALGLTSAPATVTIHVAAPPVARDDAYTTPEDVVLNVGVPGGLLANDSDPDSGFRIVTATVTPAAHGRVEVSSLGDGGFRYIPDANFTGVDTFTYQVTDGERTSAFATVTITITPVDDAPRAANDAYTTNEDTTLNASVAGNDTISGDGGNVWALATSTSNGTVTVNANGSFTYVPNANYNGTDAFTYTLCDVDGDCATATATITIVPVNDLPVAVNDTYTTDEDTTLNGSVVGNDTMSGDGGNVWSLVTGTLHGTVTVNADGTFTYVPTPNYNGTDSFTYQLCDATPDCVTAVATITILPVNDLPVAVDDAYTTPEDVTLNGSVAGNDTASPDGGNVWTLVAGTSHGTVTLNANGGFVYVPTANYTGTDVFTYRLCDVTPDCVTATATITIDPVDDAPVAVDDAYTTNEDTTLNGTVTGNDTPSGDGGNVWALVTGTTNGSVTVNADGTFTYVPNTNFNGADTFTYNVCDADGDCATAIATITITAVNDLPVAVNDAFTTAEDTPVSGTIKGNDTLSGDGGNTWSRVTNAANGTAVVNADGTFTYTPNANFTGTDSFTYTICDVDGDCSTATVTITITSVDDAPIAVNDAFTTSEDTAVSGSLRVNDTLSGDGGNVWTKTSNPANGTAVVNVDGTFTYTPNANFNGTDSFTYQLCDADGDCSIATVTLTITSVNDVPLAANDAYFTIVNTAVSGTVQSNDTESADGGNVWSIVALPTTGTVTFSATGAFTYVPATGFSGTAVFTYKVCDVDGDCATATVTITIPAQCGTGAFTTYTQGGWGASPSGSNPGAQLANSFATVFPVGYVQIGSSTRYLRFTSASAVAAFLPAGGTAGILTASLTNPTSTPAGVFAGQVLALQLNVSFSDAGIKRAGLRNQIVGSGKLTGYTVAQVLAIANAVLAGGALPAGVTLTDLNGTVDDINNNYDNGVANDGFLKDDPSCSTATAVPVARDDAFSTSQGTALTGTVATNDTGSADGGNIWSVVTNPTNGTLKFDSKGTFTYTPAAGFFGGDTFTYKICDKTGDCDPAVAVITVTAANDLPVAMNDSFVIAANTTLSGDAALNDDASTDGGNVWTRTSAPASGTVVFNANGTLTYTPATNFTGVVSFSYKLCDVNNDCSTATVTITVSSTSTGAFTTFTQGGWGAAPSGSNPGALLQSKFATVYGGTGYVQIGSTKYIRFTSASAIERFLPAGGTAGLLATTATNPKSSGGGVLSGQVLALQLSVDFSKAGITRTGLASLKLKTGKLAGYTVQNVLDLANAVLGGSSTLPSTVTVSDLTSIVDSINRNFDNGTTNNGYLE